MDPDSFGLVIDPFHLVHIGDVAAGSLANGIFQGNRSLWQQFSMTADRAFVATVAVPVLAATAGELATTAGGDYLFARGTGLLNSNDVIRIGWAWYRYSIVPSASGGFTYFGVRIFNWHAWGP
jgi:hypothetical protein